jgi:hypothetical protein
MPYLTASTCWRIGYARRVRYGLDGAPFLQNRGNKPPKEGISSGLRQLALQRKVVGIRAPSASAGSISGPSLALWALKMPRNTDLAL